MKAKKTHDVTQISWHVCDIEFRYADNYNEMEQVSRKGVLRYGQVYNYAKRRRQIIDGNSTGK